MARKVLVLGEIRDGVLRNVSFEAIAAAKTVSEGGEVVGVLLNDSASDLAQEMIAYGADRVVLVENDKLKSYTSDGFGQAFLQVIDAEKPEGILIGHTALGKDLSPEIAAKIESGLISDAIAVEVTGDQVVFTRPIYSGKAFEKKIITTELFLQPFVQTILLHLKRMNHESGEVTSIDAEFKDLRTVVKEVVLKTTNGVDLI